MRKNSNKVFGILSLFGVLLMSGCWASPDVRWVEAARLTYKAVAPEYLEYVKADTSLDEEQKEDRVADIQSWDDRITEAEQSLGK